MEQRISGEKTACAQDKVTRYAWTIRNAPGEFLMIPKTELDVDHAYQRNRINERRVEELARAWDWIACGCLVVALRDDNKWFVIDGQHRKLAADQRSDIHELPCLVFETTSRRDEAVSFLAINQGRAGVGSLDRYKALLLAGEGARRVGAELGLPWAIYVPPAKDLREFVRLGGTRAMIENTLKQTVWNI